MRLTRPFRGILVASREYLKAKGVPKTIGDLHRHNCIGMRLTGSGGILDWELMDGKTITTVKTSGTALVTDSTQAPELARRRRLCRRTVGAPIHPRGPPQMVAAAVRRRVRWIVSLLSAACIAGAEAARLHQGRKDRTPAITIYDGRVLSIGPR